MALERILEIAPSIVPDRFFIQEYQADKRGQFTIPTCIDMNHWTQDREATVKQVATYLAQGSNYGFRFRNLSNDEFTEKELIELREDIACITEELRLDSI